MEQKGWYNGYDWNERYAKLRELNRRVSRGEMQAAGGPCQLCGDPTPKSVEYHDEDYSREYMWRPPAIFILCRHCHRTKLHKRFSQPEAWNAFLAHVRRGGYASDLAAPEIKREVKAYELSLKQGATPSPLRVLPGRTCRPSSAWYEALSVDPVTVTADAPRPRP